VAIKPQVDLNGKKPYVITACVLAGIVFTLTLIRAASTGITYDEAYTYLYYGRDLGGFLQVDFANNHPLNSLLIYLSSTLIGLAYNEFVIRLPNLAAYALYLFAAVRFSGRSRYPYLALTLLVLNYTLDEFFGLARGYGIAAALVLLAVDCYYSDRSDVRNMIKAAYLLTLAAVASFPILVFSGVFILYAVLVDIRLPRLAAVLRRYWYHGIILAAVSILVGLDFLRVTGAGLPSVGGGSFFASVFLGYAGMFISNPVGGMALAWAMLIFFVLAGLLLRKKILFLPCTALLILYFVISAVAAAAGGRNIPAGRLLLPLWPILAVAVVEIVQELEPMLPERMGFVLFQRVAFGLVVLLLAANYAKSIDLTSTAEWKEDYAVRRQVYAAALNGKPLDVQYQKHPSAVFYKQKFLEEYGVNIFTAR
jgi:hypothetical protein